jgi:hypothetical protein
MTSTPFYTSLDGYKMCVRLYFNGDGVGQSTHLSIFLVLMRGNYDAVLKWPFNFQVIFGLYDLKNQKDHIVQSFQSDIKLKSFQQPQTEMNVGTGISKFVPLSKILHDNSSYVDDNTIYIKVMIRKDPIPSHVLSLVMNIDPALPVHIQEEKIQEEIRRNKIPPYKFVLTLKS